jgi:hypothetical protein
LQGNAFMIENTLQIIPKLIQTASKALPLTVTYLGL